MENNRDMPRLPQPGSDAGNWGNLLNDFLATAHDSNGNLKNGTVSLAKLAIGNSPSNGQVLSYNGTGLSWTTLSGSGTVADASTTTKGIVQLAGDLAGTSASPTVPGLAAKANTVDVVTLAGNQTITGTKNFTGVLQSNGTAVVLTNDARLSGSSTPADGSIGTTKLADNSITEPKLSAANAPTSGQILSYNGTNFTWVSAPTGASGDPTVGGDLSGTASNAQIVTGAVGVTQLASNAVTTVKIADANVTTAKIADSNVTAEKIANSSITEPKLAISNDPATNQVLSWNGTALAWATPAAGSGGGSSWKAVSISTAYTAASGDFVVGDTSTSGYTVTLPAATNGAYVTVKKLTNNTNSILVAPPSGQINAGSNTSVTIAVNSFGQVADFIADGSTWHQVG
jgi:hypothetical protein